MPTCGASANIARRDHKDGLSAGGGERRCSISIIPSLEEFKVLAQVKGETCASLYLPTSPLGSRAKANRTAFKDLAKESPVSVEGSGLSTRPESLRLSSSSIASQAAEPDVQDQDKVPKASSTQSRIRSIPSGIIRPAGWRC